MEGLRRRAAGVLAAALVVALSVAGRGTAGGAGRPTDAPRLWGGLEPGPYAVGFEILGVRDSTRSIPEGGPRPIQVALWYPAVDSPGAAPVTYRDYVAPIAAERSLETPSDSLAGEAIEGFVALLASNGVDAEATEAWLSSPMAAVAGAPPADGAFPLVLIAPGTFHTAYHHAILAEYLASHGYVVAVSPSPSRLAGPPGEGEVLALARTQAENLAFVRRALAASSRVDPGRAAIVAHSFGARSALLALLDGTWRGLVSLDGGIANAKGREWLDGAGFDPEAIRAPILHLWEDVDPEIVEPDFGLLDSLSHAETTVVRVEGLHHVHFTSLGLVSGLVPGIRVGPASSDVVRKSVAVHEAVRAFLDERLGGASPGVLDAVIAGSPDLRAR